MSASNPEKVWPSVSVIVVTKGHHAEAEAAVASIRRSSYPGQPPEIVVIEETNGSTPIMGPSVHYHAIPVRNLGVGYARNQGVAVASGDVLVFTDDDCIVDQEWLKEIIRPLVERPDVEATAGAVWVPACGLVGQCENILGFPGGGMKYVHAAGGKIVPMRSFSTCNCAIRRVLKHVNLRFHEGFAYAGEDELLSRAIAARSPILYNPAARVVHKPRDSFAGVFRWFMRRGQARYEMLKYAKCRKDQVWYAVSTSLFLRLLLVVGFCLATGLPVAVVLVVLFALGYLSVIWRHAWALSYHASGRALALLPFVKGCMDAGMDAGFVKAFVQDLKS